MPLSPYDQQLALLRARQATDTRVNLASQTVNPQVAAGTVAQANAYPWLTPQSAYGLAQQGAQPGDPLSQSVATGVLNHKGGGFWGELGHLVTAPVRSAVHFATTAMSDVADVAQPITRGLLTAAETPLQVGMGALRDVAAVSGTIGAGFVSGAATGAAVGVGGGIFGGVGVIPGIIGGTLIGGTLGAIGQVRGVKVQSSGLQNPFAQSTGGLAIGNLIAGNQVDLGSGYLPGGAIHEQQAKNAQATAAINGHALTPGRMLASTLVRPGTTPYNLLSGLTDAVDSWELDPSRYVGEEFAAQKAAGKIPGLAGKFIPGAVEAEAGPLTQTLRNLTGRAGILDTADPAVHTDLAREFLQTDGAAQRFITKAAATDSAAEIRAASKGKIPVAIANQLAAHTTEQGVLDTLLNGVEGGTLKEADAVRQGKGIASTFTATRPGARLNQVMERLGGYLPKQTVDLIDVGKPGSVKLDNAVDQMDNFLKQARYAPADRNAVLNRLMAASTPEDAARVFQDTVNGGLRDRLLNLGHDTGTVDGFLKSAKADTQLLEKTAVNELADDRIAKAVHTGDQALPLAKPEQVAEYTRYTYHLPDPTDLRRLTTPQSTKIGEGLSALYNSDGWKESTHAMDWFMQKFRVGVTVRPALALRTMAATHAFMAANGLETRFSDIPNLLRMVTNPEFRTAFEEGAVAGATPLAKAEGYLASLRKISGHISPEEQAAHQLIVGPGHELFPQAWTSRLAELHADPVARSVAGQGFEGTAQSFWDGPLAAERSQLAADLNKPELLQSREAADAYVRDTVGSHLTSLTADNPHLMEAIATGHVPTFEGFERGAGVPLLAEHGDGLVNPDAVDHLANMALDPSIKVPTEVVAAKSPKLVDPDYGHKVGRMTSWFYSNLLGKPIDFFYNSPALNQLYWKNLAEQAHLLDSSGVEELSARIAENSGKVDIPADARKILDTRIAKGATGSVPLADLDHLVQARAVDGLQALTIDMAKKTGWQDSARILMPFGKHWQQELTRWASLAETHPEAIRKAQMTVQGAIGSGFFHKDDYGKYVFNYPGSDLLSRVVTGTPMPMTASAGGLSAMTSSLMPGFGPLVSIAASKILPNKPEYDDVRAFFSPFGDPTQKGVLSAVEPAWAKTLQTALADPEHDRDAGNTTMQVARYLVSTGKYNTNTPEAQDQLLKEAGSRAKKLLTLQALGKFVLPSSPSLEAIARAKGTYTPDGRTVTAKLLSDDLQKMRTDDYEHSSENFLAKYGDSALLFMQAATRPNTPGAASTTEQSDFLRSNPEVAKALPNSAAFFAPQGGQTFDPASIARQIHMGDRQALTPKQQVALANDQVASMQYYAIKDGLGPRISAGQQAVLSQIKQVLTQQYPGFNTIVPGLAARVTDSPQNIQKVLIPELEKSLTIDRTKNSETGKALDQYLQLRTAIDQIGQSRGLKPGSFAQSTKSTDLRALLRNAAVQLSQSNQGFSMLFDRILDRELRTDATPAAAAAVA